MSRAAGAMPCAFTRTVHSMIPCLRYFRSTSQLLGLFDVRMQMQDLPTCCVHFPGALNFAKLTCLLQKCLILSRTWNQSGWHCSIAICCSLVNQQLSCGELRIQPIGKTPLMRTVVTFIPLILPWFGGSVDWSCCPG